NLACNYSSCDDIPDAEGCMYAENYSAFHADFTADNCVQYGGTACVEAPAEVVGCLDVNASNYDAAATVQAVDQYANLLCIYTSCDDIPDAEGCIYANAYSCFHEGFNAANCEQYGGTACVEEVELTFTQADIDAAYAAGAASVTPEDGVSQTNVDEAYGWGYGDGAASVTAEDGVSQADVDAAVAAITPEDGVSQADVDAAVAAITPEDGVSQADVDAQADLSYGYGYGDGAASVTAEDGVSQADVDAAVAAITPEDGVSQADVDAAVAAVDVTSDNQAVADEAYGLGYGDGAASVTPEDGVSQADVDAAVAAITPEDGVSQADVDAVQAQLEEALANAGGGSAEPIFIDIVEGWNILGYTLPYGQDVTATVADIVDNILIVKNNAAQVYWPEFAFNGIGDFVPGQGYQIKTTAAISDYTWPDVDGQRVELTPTVPAWAFDMEAEIHPNDIRSLVKVVNMLGQEVNVVDQFSGEVLLHLFNDGTVEKKIVR
ncbi:MAG: hypothetical protein NZ604_01760, partial [Flavobacteriales bacterium]|nr:hypothetical protein [Flavobacteriales bacterium]